MGRGEPMFSRGVRPSRYTSCVSNHPTSIVRAISSGLLCACTLLCGGCSADEPLNPSFALVYNDAKAVLRQMQLAPKPLQRPLIVAAGIHDPGFVAPSLVRKLRAVTSDPDRIISVSFFALSLGTFDACREHLVDAVEQAFPSNDPEMTVEVDVIGYSMGGLVARHAAGPNASGKRLRIKRLFTISTPHRGAKLAGLPTFDERTIDMRAGSAFLAGLDSQLQDAQYELLSYTRLGDMIVGAENASVPGTSPWWVTNAPFSPAHLAAPTDPRILADIARRLRNEEPFATNPPAPLPDKEPTGGEVTSKARGGRRRD